MDRFIEMINDFVSREQENLKSNMDRFIGYKKYVITLVLLYLKSSMDRFIVDFAVHPISFTQLFKIQYG